MGPKGDRVRFPNKTITYLDACMSNHALSCVSTCKLVPFNVSYRVLRDLVVIKEKEESLEKEDVMARR